MPYAVVPRASISGEPTSPLQIEAAGNSGEAAWTHIMFSVIVVSPSHVATQSSWETTVWGAVWSVIGNAALSEHLWPQPKVLSVVPSSDDGGSLDSLA